MRKFQKTYTNDPVAFVHDCFRWKDGRGPTVYQDEILADYTQGVNRQAIRGPHGLGKTALAAWLVLWFALTREGKDWKIPTTASVWRQLTKYLWPEIKKWSRLVKWNDIGREPFNERYELQTKALNLSTGQAFAVASSDHTAIEGAHADHLFYVYDESKSIEDATFDASEGAFSMEGDEEAGTEALAFMISTPGAPMGRFYEVHSRKPGYEDWKVRHVTREECIDAKRMTRQWADQRARQWGERSAIYLNRVIGDFAADEEDVVIPLQWVEAAVARWQEWKDKIEDGTIGELPPITQVGLDIGLGGEKNADTAMAIIRDSHICEEIRNWPRMDVDSAIMQSAGRLVGLHDKWPDMESYVDVIGIGAGCYQRVKEQDYKKCYPFNSSNKTDLKDKLEEFGFINHRAAAWWFMREALMPNSGEDIMLPDDDRLLGELSSPKYQVMSGGRLKIEAKEDVVKRLGRSTDYADAALYGFFGPKLARMAPAQVYIVGKGFIEVNENGR